MTAIYVAGIGITHFGKMNIPDKARMFAAFDGARIAIPENGGGLYGIEEAVVAVNILARQ